MTILVTGGAGFLGSHLVDRLLAEDHDVVVVDDLSGGTEDNIDLYRGGFYQGDCRDPQFIADIIEAVQPEVIFHLAANAAENKAQFSPIDITSRNWNAFINTLTPFIKHGGRRFVFTSSIAVYGAGQTPFRETDKPEPEDLYGISKHAAEQALKIMSRVHEFEYVIARPHNVYGPRQNMKDPYRNVVTIWMNSLLRGDPLPIYGDGNQLRQFSFISDVVDQLHQCGFTDVAGQTFNLGSSKSWTLNELADAIEKVAKSKTGRLYLPSRPQEVKIALADHTRADQALGKAVVQLTEGLAATWQWCEKQGPQDPLYTEIEIPSDKLPSNWKK